MNIFVAIATIIIGNEGMNKKNIKVWYEVSFIRYGKKKCRHYRNVTTELLENMMKNNCHYIKVIEVEQVTKRISVTDL